MFGSQRVKKNIIQGKKIKKKNRRKEKKIKINKL